MRHLLPRPPRAIGKRGQVLLILGFIWIVIGVNVWQNPDPASWAHLPILHDVPRWIRGSAWIVTGLLAIAFAWRPQRIEHDGVGFLALYVMPAERVGIFFYGWLDYVFPFGGPGYSRGLLSAAVYLAIVALVMVCARWADPPPDLTPRPKRRLQRGRR